MWVRQCDLDAQADAPLPIPARIASNEEFIPPPQTPQQKEYEARVQAISEQAARRQGLSRRDFLRSGSGMAAALLALNQVFGPCYEVAAEEADDQKAFEEKWPKDQLPISAKGATLSCVCGTCGGCRGPPLTRSFPMRLAIAYERCSRGHQSKGTSFERQETLTERVCRKRKWTLHPTLSYTEKRSAFRGKHRLRGRLKELLLAVENGTIPPGSVVVIEAFNRLSREPLNAAFNTFQGILHGGVDICICRPFRIYTRSSLDELETMMMVNLEMARAHQESREKSSWGKARWARVHRNGAEQQQPHGMRPPGWLTVEDGKYKLVPARAAILRQVIKWMQQGQGRRRILKRMEADPKRYPPWGRSQKWSDVYLREILKNPALWGAWQQHQLDEKGKSVPVGEPVEGYYPPLLSREEFEDLQRLIQGRAKKGGRPSRDERNVLVGLIQDSAGFKLYITRATSHGHSYLYLKPAPEALRRENSSSYSLPYEPIEGAVLRAVTELKGSDLDPPGPAQEEHAQAGDKMKAERDAIKAALRARQAALEDPSFEADALPELLAAIRVLKQKLAAAEGELAKAARSSSYATSKALEEAQSVIGRLDKASDKELPELRYRLRLLLAGVLEGVWVYQQTEHRLSSWIHLQLWTKTGVMRYVLLFKGERPPTVRPLNLRDVDFREGYPSGLARG